MRCTAVVVLCSDCCIPCTGMLTIFNYIYSFSLQFFLPKVALLPLQTLFWFNFSLSSLIYPILRHPTGYAKSNAASTRLFTWNIFTFNATLGRISVQLYFHKPDISTKICMCVICRCVCNFTYMYISVCKKQLVQKKWLMRWWLTNSSVRFFHVLELWLELNPKKGAD